MRKNLKNNVYLSWNWSECNHSCINDHFSFQPLNWFSLCSMIYDMLEHFVKWKYQKLLIALKERQWCWYFRFYLSCTSKKIWCIENNVQQNYRFYFSLDDIIDQFWFLKKCLNHSLVSIRCFSMSTIICKYWKDTFTLESPPSFHLF